MTKNRKEQLLKLLRSSNLEDIKLGCLLLAREPISVVRDIFKNGDTRHKCEDVPWYLPEHRLENKRGPAESIVIYTHKVGLCQSSPDDRVGDPNEFF